MSLFGALASDPTMKTYNLSCVLFPVIQGHNDVRARGNCGIVQSQMICLVPVEGTAKDMFLAAWAPEVADETPEVMCMVDNVGMCKACVCTPNENCNQYHLFVMSQDAEERLIAFYNAVVGQGNNPRLNVRVLPETTEAQDLVNDVE